MTREKTLEKAMICVCGDRDREYGAIGNQWNGLALKSGCPRRGKSSWYIKYLAGKDARTVRW